MTLQGFHPLMVSLRVHRFSPLARKSSTVTSVVSEMSEKSIKTVIQKQRLQSLFSLAYRCMYHTRTIFL
jgi:hypothetical protein